MVRPALLVGVALAGAANPWDKYMLAPGPDRTQRPVKWRATAAGMTPTQPTAGSQPWPPVPLPVRLSGKGASLMFDWGQETGGFTTLAFGTASDATQSLSLAYSEGTCTRGAVTSAEQRLTPFYLCVCPQLRTTGSTATTATAARVRTQQSRRVLLRRTARTHRLRRTCVAASVI